MKRWLIILMVVVLVTACFIGFGACETKTNAVKSGKYGEAPMLAEMVKKGELPPVEERLPKNPRVGVIDIYPKDLKVEIGRYGGTLRLVGIDKGTIDHDAGWINNKGSQGLQCPGLAHNNLTLEPDFYESFKMSDDAKEFTFKLREGVKWSDGKPITTEDFNFWYNIGLKDKRISPAFPTAFKSGGRADREPMKLEIIDDYTLKLISTEPYVGFLAEFTYNRSYPTYQAEFMKQFHIDYTSEEELNKKCKEFGFLEGEWFKLFTLFAPASGISSDRVKGKFKAPVYSPYIITKLTDAEAVLERNPYYWKVDKEGNQLPYIDRLHVSLVNDMEAATLKIINGECDLVRRCVTALNMSLYKENEEKGGYKTYLFKQHASLAEVFLNLNHDDPVWREVVNDLRFRRALSYATNRDRIIDLLYLGLAGKPRVIPLNEYDPDKANKLLDEMGLDKKDSEGYRLGPDGKRFVIPFQIGTFTGEEEKVIELLVNMYKEIGICTTMKKFDNSLWIEMMTSNSVKAFTWWAHYPRWPWHENLGYLGKAWQYTYCPKWFQWYESEGQKGEEPSAEYKELRELINKMYTSVDPQKQQEYWEAAKKNITENVWWIPIVDDVINPLILNSKLGNIPKDGYAIDIAAGPVVQMYFKE